MNVINRALMNNADAVRRARKAFREGSEAPEADQPKEPDAVTAQLVKMVFAKPPDRLSTPSWVGPH